MGRRKIPTEVKLAEALKSAKELSIDGVLSARDLKDSHRKILDDHGCLYKIYTTWFALVMPGVESGDTVPLMSSYWTFIRLYSRKHLGDDWWLSSLSSIAVHAGDEHIPTQLHINTSKKHAKNIELKGGYGIAFYQQTGTPPNMVETIDSGLNVIKAHIALMLLSGNNFKDPSPSMLAIAHNLKLAEVSEIVAALKQTGAQIGGERVYTLLKSCGKTREAKALFDGLARLDMAIKGEESTNTYTLGASRIKSPIATRIKLKFQQYSESIKASGHYPVCKKVDFKNSDFEFVRDSINATYVSDAYHSLSIENYRVTKELIEKIASNNWDPEGHDGDKKHLDAFAAKGYNNAFRQILEDLKSVHDGENVVEVVSYGYMSWRELLFSEQVNAGLLDAGVLSGFRNKPIFIKTSSHVPPAHEKLMDAMDVFFEALGEEDDPWVRAVLGHFFLVHIHPFSDGNGRTARFLMNVFLVASGYPWLVIVKEDKKRYFECLEKAHINEDIDSFAVFLADGLSGKK